MVDKFVGRIHKNKVRFAQEGKHLNMTRDIVKFEAEIGQFGYLPNPL